MHEMKAVGMCLWQLILSYLVVSFAVPAGFPPLAAIRRLCVDVGTFMGYSLSSF